MASIPYSTFPPFHTLGINHSSKIKNSAKPLCSRGNIGRTRPLPGSSLCFHLRSTRGRLAALNSASFRFSPISFIPLVPHFSQPFRRATWLSFVSANAGSRLYNLFYLSRFLWNSCTSPLNSWINF